MKAITSAATVFAIGLLATVPAHAQSICDLVTAGDVQTVLKLPGTLVAVPDTQWGNGCDYNAPPSENPVVEILVADDAGMDNISLNNHRASSNDSNQHVSGIGDAAIYFDNTATPNAGGAASETRQNLIFRKDHKIIDFVVIGTAVPESDIFSLGKLIAAKPIGALKDPSN